MKKTAFGFLLFCAAAGCAAIAVARPPQAPPSLMLPENQVTHVSDHVWAIIGFPNIGIVVGSRATLVVDTGLGPRNGAIALHEAQKLAKGPVLYSDDDALPRRARRGRRRVSSGHDSGAAGRAAAGAGGQRRGVRRDVQQQVTANEGAADGRYVSRAGHHV